MENFYNKPREKGEENLLESMHELIEQMVDKESADIFINHSDIQAVKDKNSVVQRFIISKTLVSLLMIFKSYKPEVNVATDVLPYIISDGTIGDWKSMLKEVVIKFFQLHNVIKVVNTELNKPTGA